MLTLLFAALTAAAAPTQAQAVGGWWHTCLVVDGQVWCWGNDTYGQLGDGVRTDTPSPPARVGSLSDAVALGSGTFHTCALRRTGRTVCWGSNGYGQLGAPGRPGDLWPPTEIPLDDVVQVVGGGYQTVWLQRDGTAWQAGHGSNGPSKLPLSGIVEVAAGEGATAALGSDGRVWSWTKNDAPVDVGLTNVVQIAAHRDNLCARNSEGRVLCWGDNRDGRLGNGTETPSATPVAVEVWGAMDLWPGGGGFCARTDIGAMCWGGDERGGLGDGTTERRVLPRLAPEWDNGVPMHSSNGFHSCVMRPTEMRCWGFNWGGQLGDGGTQQRATSQPVTQLPGAPAAPKRTVPTFEVALEQGGRPIAIENERARVEPGAFTLVFRFEATPYVKVHADRGPIGSAGLFAAGAGMAEPEGNPEGALLLKGAAAFQLWNEERMDGACEQSERWTCRRTVRSAPDDGEIHLVMGTEANQPVRRLVIRR